jgi:hypothetical protein
MPPSFLPFADTTTLAIALCVAAIGVSLLWWKGLPVPRGAKIVLSAASLLLALAAGEPNWMLPAAKEVVVMVDLSPSTRGAAYRDRAALDRRIRELLGSTPYRIELFADGTPVHDHGRVLADLPAERTRFTPPAAAAVLLFTDGRFPLPAAAPPTYAVVDPELVATNDARVASLATEGPDAVAHIDSTLSSRTLGWSGSKDDAIADEVKPGGYLLRRPITAGTSEIVARLSAGDRWPENDALSITPAPTRTLERWFVSAGGSPPVGFRSIAPLDLPTDSAAYLSASAIVLDNVPAAALPPVARERLAQYVKELGGALLISGGDHAFAAGGYVGTLLDALSPLASNPPRPATHWILLTDSSGSMAAATSGASGTRWQQAVDALLRLLPSLPADDLVDIGSFSDRVTWWSSGRSAQQTRGEQLPPASVSPGGPTDLRPALENAAAHHDPALPGHLLLLSDADAEIGDIPSLIALLKSRNIRLHVLAIEAGRALADLQRVTRETGGKMVRQDEAARWSAAASELLSAASEKHLHREPVTIRFGGPLSSIPAGRTDLWNRTWLKPRATELAATEPPTVGAESVPLAAVWQVGEGRVAAAAFGATPPEIDAILAHIARPPRDPRINVTWRSGPVLRVQIDAADASPDTAEPFLNGRNFRLELSAEGSAPRQYPLHQVGPGRYEMEVESPRRSMLATIRDGTRVIERFAVAGRYAPEFDGIGIDRDNLEQLARQTGGRVIDPQESKPIDFRWPRREISLTSWVATGGMFLLLGALLWARILPLRHQRDMDAPRVRAT